MAKFTPQELAEKHARRTTAAVPDMIKGVEAVQVSPTNQAADKKDKLVARWNEAINSGKWERGLRNVSLDQWKTSMKEKGANRVAAGIAGAKDKMVAFYAELIPFQSDLSAKIASMPDLTLEDSIARATAQIRGMSTFRKGKTR